jgi:transcriptional regulator GlxA family with amidase domain
VIALTYDGVELLDVTGPLNVFTAATRLARDRAGYSVEIVAPAAGPVRTAGGVELVAKRATAVRGAIDIHTAPSRT